MHRQIIAAAVTTLLTVSSAAACGFDWTQHRDLELDHDEGLLVVQATLTGAGAGTDSTGQLELDIRFLYEDGSAEINPTISEDLSGDMGEIWLVGPGKQFDAGHIESGDQKTVIPCLTADEMREVAAGKWSAVMKNSKYPGGELRGPLQY